MPRKKKKTQAEIDAEFEAENAEYERWWNTVPLEIKVAVKRKSWLERCLRFRQLLKTGTPHMSPEGVRFGLKFAQKGLVDTRRLRETGRWPTKH